MFWSLTCCSWLHLDTVCNRCSFKVRHQTHSNCDECYAQERGQQGEVIIGWFWETRPGLEHSWIAEQSSRIVGPKGLIPSIYKKEIVSSYNIPFSLQFLTCHVFKIFSLDSLISKSLMEFEHLFKTMNFLSWSKSGI